jgi:hypothetical protein
MVKDINKLTGSIMKFVVACLVLLTGVHGIANAQVPSYVCEKNPEIVGSCFNIQGLLYYANGTPSARIWPVGTRRILGINNDKLPKDLENKMHDFDDQLRGEFRVCPLTREQAGHMRFVCIESWNNIQARQRQYIKQNKPRQPA